MLDELGFDAPHSARRLARRDPRRATSTRVPRSADDVYMLYTGGTTGMPKGVMWRHEDFFYACCMGGSPLDPIKTPSEIVRNARTRVSDEPARARAADARRRPMAHVDRALRRQPCGRVRRAPLRSRARARSRGAREGHDDRHHRRRDGASAGRSSARGARSLGLLARSSCSATAARCSARGQSPARRRVPERGASTTATARRRRARPAAKSARAPKRDRPAFHDRRPHVGARSRHARATRTRQRHGRTVRAQGLHPARLLEGSREDRRDVPHRPRGCALGRARRLGHDRRRGPHRAVRARFGVHQHGRREGVPGGGRGRDSRPPRRVRRRRRRRARRSFRPEGRGACRIARRRGPELTLDAIQDIAAR